MFYLLFFSLHSRQSIHTRMSIAYIVSVYSVQLRAQSSELRLSRCTSFSGIFYNVKVKLWNCISLDTRPINFKRFYLFKIYIILKILIFFLWRILGACRGEWNGKYVSSEREGEHRTQEGKRRCNSREMKKNKKKCNIEPYGITAGFVCLAATVFNLCS